MATCLLIEKLRIISSLVGTYRPTLTPHFGSIPEYWVHRLYHSYVTSCMLTIFCPCALFCNVHETLHHTNIMWVGDNSIRDDISICTITRWGEKICHDWQLSNTGHFYGRGIIRSLGVVGNWKKKSP